MQTEVILPLVAYLLLVFGLSVYAYSRRQSGNFLSDTSSATVRWAALCWR